MQFSLRPFPVTLKSLLQKPECYTAELLVPPSDPMNTSKVEKKVMEYQGVQETGNLTVP